MMLTNDASNAGVVRVTSACTPVSRNCTVYTHPYHQPAWADIATEDKKIVIGAAGHMNYFSLGREALTVQT
jgi:hypothetical protein